MRPIVGQSIKQIVPTPFAQPRVNEIFQSIWIDDK